MKTQHSARTIRYDTHRSHQPRHKKTVRSQSYDPSPKRPSILSKRADVPARVLTPVMSVEEAQVPPAEDKHDGWTIVVVAPGMV